MWFAVGNQAGDADSIVSAILAAHLLSQQGKECKAVVSFHRKDFRLRGDAIQLFRLANWEFTLEDNSIPANLTFLDEVTVLDQLVLTDANVLGPHLKSMCSDKVKVMAIFDHHRDEGSHLDASPRIVDEAAGSACSVIGKEIFTHDIAISEQLCILMYGVILLDTRNFTEGRHSQADLDVLSELSKHIPESLLQQRDQIYKKLMDARNDVSHLTFSELLRLDYKEVAEHDQRLGFSTVFDTISNLIDPSRQVEKAMLEMMETNRLIALCAITSVETDSEKRGLIICASDKSLNDAIVLGLQTPPKDVFSSEFLSLPLCSSQKILERGFGLEPVKLATSDRSTASPKAAKVTHSFSMWTIYGTITRKTLLPGILELLGRSKRL